MLFIDIIPTCLLVYIANISPKYSKAEDTIVEEFKEWKSDSMKLKSVKQATYSVLWTLTVFLYFLISFITFAWYATWMIFLIAICAQAIIEYVSNERTKIKKGANTPLCSKKRDSD